MTLRRIILSGHDYTVVLKSLLPHITSEPVQAYHEFMQTLVEAIRYRDKAMCSIVMMLKNLDQNLERQYSAVRPDMVRIVRALTMELLYQAEEYQLYNQRSVLMYTYYRHPDFTFDDVILTNIIPLTWNGHLYESNTYP